MTQPPFSVVRSSLAAYITAKTGLRASSDRFGTISAPMAVVVPVTGTSITYADAMGDGGCEISLRILVLTSEASSTQGTDAMDPYLATTGSQSIYAAVQADPTIGGVVQYAVVREATGYGALSWNGIDYLAVSIITDIVI